MIQGGVYKDLARDVAHDNARRQDQQIGNDPSQHTVSQDLQKLRDNLLESSTFVQEQG